ncbi:hypothetical protein [Burkholderia arboris]|uniref:hypothetical protein n=1 Tax=Burkholderia arboris TaxID=488730 RepID=UPI001583B7BA|nr:hypothetical protein [Burkholderia arboris]
MVSTMLIDELHRQRVELAGIASRQFAGRVARKAHRHWPFEKQPGRRIVTRGIASARHHPFTDVSETDSLQTTGCALLFPEMKSDRSRAPVDRSGCKGTKYCCYLHDGNLIILGPNSISSQPKSQ